MKNEKLKENDSVFVNPFKEDIKQNKAISIEDFIEVCPEYKHLYEYMKSRYITAHTYNMWKNIAKKAEERLSKPKSISSINIEYYLKFKSISKEAASLFDEYVGKVSLFSSTNAVSDKDINDYVIDVIRNTLSDFTGVSYNVDREAFIEICKLKKDEFEKNRLDIFKDVKDKVVKHFEDIGFTLSERNLNSIEWWVHNYKIQY